ncbi:tetraspanin-2 [Protopterus annectens]|uniref:tetraspanin-2 n=1 Tax=Protopterus annectens TaxID=7888 RepID=UPI001CFC22CC|nr:tetraspanin-2 [Protopterus annectens]
MGSLSGGMSCIKYLLFFFNFIFWLAGSAVFAIALWLRLDKDASSLSGGSSVSIFIGEYILMGCGGLMMLVGFCGCCGAVQESQCLLGTFFTCLLIIFAAEVAAGVYGFLNKDEVVSLVKDTYKVIQDEYITGKDNDTLPAVHKSFNCCGDGINISKINDTCPDNGKTHDCNTKIEESLNKKMHIIGVVGLGIAGIMIFGMIFSMLLCCAIRNSRDVI